MRLGLSTTRSCVVSTCETITRERAEHACCTAHLRALISSAVFSMAANKYSGGSAGGFTVLACLAFMDVFAAGASHYGVADLEMLARDTHKFESRYVRTVLETSKMLRAFLPPMEMRSFACVERGRFVASARARVRMWRRG